MLARDIRHALDPATFAEAAGITCDQWQAALLHDRPRRALLCCSRQSGKSTVTALHALHTALYEAGSLVVLPGARAKAKRGNAALHKTNAPPSRQRCAAQDRIGTKT